MNLYHLKRIVKKIVNYFFRFISFFIRRSNKIVIFGGWFGNRFADNSKALFLFMSQNKKELALEKVIYTTKNAKIVNELKGSGYDALYVGSLLSLKYHLKAGYHVVDMGGKDLLRNTSCDATRVNLWHGFPLKKIGYYTTNPDFSLENAIEHNNHQEELGYWNKVYNLVVSEKHKQLQQHAFGLDEEKMIIGIYPRIAYMLGIIDKFYLKSEIDAKDKIEHLLKSKKKIVGYFPTFRDDSKMNQKCFSLPNDITDFLNSEDAYLITKMHFASDAQLIKGNERVINLLPESDVYNFLYYLDILITDYSSIYFDFLIFNKPIIFYCFDLDYYINKDRGFLIDYETFAPGDKVYSVNELKEALKIVIIDSNSYLNKYEKEYTATQELTNLYSREYTYKNLIELSEKILSIRA